MNRRITFLCICLLATFALQAQTFTGKVVDEKSQPLPYANVVLLSLPDSAFVAGTVSDESGAFTLRSEKPELLLRVSSIGYATLYNKVEKADLGTLQLMPDAQLLGEVVVKGDLPITRMHGDALVTNVQNSVLSKAGSASDVLGKMPGITKTDDAFEVFGKGTPLIYINGRKVRDMSELEQLGSDEVKNVEVIRNPGSRYDVTVKAVIRIQTVRREGEGWGLNLRSSYYQSRNTDWVEQASVNYRHHGLDLFGTIFFSRIEDWNKADTWHGVQGTELWEHNQTGIMEYRLKQLTGILGFNYQVNDNHTFGVRYQPQKYLDWKGYGPASNRVTVDGVEHDYLTSFGKEERDYDLGHYLNAYYNGKAGKVEIDLNADYYQDGESERTVTQETSRMEEDRNIHSFNKVKNRLAAGKLILSFPLGGGTFAVGSEATYTHRTDDYLNEENYVPTSYSKIEELNATAFAEYNRSFPWGDWSVGLRYEHVKFDYYENGNRVDEQSRVFDDLFPHVSFSTRLGPVQTQLSYTAKTVRPSYSKLSNNVSYVDRYTMQTGNPTLRPTVIHDVTLTGVWRFMQLSLSYSRNKDWMLYWGDILKEDGSQVMIRFRNLDESVPVFSAFLGTSPTVGCWSPMLGIGVQKQWLTVESDGKPLRLDTPIWSFTFNNTWNLPLGFLLSLDMNLQTQGDYQNMKTEYTSSSVNLSLRKSFLNDALSVEVRGTDLFDTYREANRLYNGYYTLYQKNNRDRREFSLTLRYKFNATKSKYKGTGAGQEQRSRM